MLIECFYTCFFMKTKYAFDLYKVIIFGKLLDGKF